ncbi:DUF1189 family protein [Aerococcus urinae]|uniref:DUF1189 family protein n=1 Tax=Aerococcus urinae TaxID=1376 RepID=A0A0X8FF53_9LACT|nr:DUF1189 family protein [Aerococcus urinae]AMB96182.1 hypothetical protein AWM73_06585 [Aerococcus urinae]MCY3033366.1 DUF1189 family protein [Aerococcus urinae]MCY3038558.1 DUF1189 family protein [Aerococcus urinae]MCY3045468.1 DUF1189 family protein [Aerococcus urinae]MCY3048867.1 DUF1189 family protein [Aerococcus urinae]
MRSSLKNILTSAYVYRQRRSLNTFGMVVVILVLSLILTLPFALGFQGVNNEVFDQSYQELLADFPSQRVDQKLKDYALQEGQLVSREGSEEREQKLDEPAISIGFLPELEELDTLFLNNPSAFIFLEDMMVYQPREGDDFSAPYNRNTQTKLSSQELLEQFYQNYQKNYRKNQKYLFVGMRHILFLLFLILYSLLAAVVLNRLRLAQRFDFYNLKECYGASLLSLILPSLLASLWGYFHLNNRLMALLVILFSIGQLIMAYHFTGFKEKSLPK